MPTQVVRASTLERFNFGDLAIADYTAGSGTTSSIAVIDVPAGAEHPAAYSEASDKYYLVLTGTVTFRTDGGEVTLGPLDLLIIPRGTVFAYVSRDGPSQMVLVHTPPFRADAEILTGALNT
jgi:mannose-6-phosphate isomerase-like protein (cupin superfamily)